MKKKELKIIRYIAQADPNICIIRIPQGKAKENKY